MSIDECAAHVGSAVVYTPPGENRYALEDGVITSTSKSFVFVRFVGDNWSKACSPGDVELKATS